MKQYILAIDIGTTSAKGLAVTTTGDVLTSQQVFYPTHYPKPGYAEQDPVAICNGVFTLIETIISQNRSTAQIEGISLSAAMHSLMAASEEGDPLSPLIIWADTRSSKEAVELRNSELGPVLHYQTGAPIHPMTPLCKLLWMKEHDPKFIKAPRLISIKEFFVKKLTGEFLVDYSIASASGLFDIHLRKWHTGALQLTGVAESQLSTPVSIYHQQKLLPEVMIRFSVADIPLIIGSSDGCLAQLGSDAMREGDLTITIGTSAAVRRAVKEVKHDPQQKNFNYLMRENVFISGGPSNNGTVIVDWYNREFNSGTQNLVKFVEDALTVQPGCDGLLALPFLQGERAPMYDPYARGVFFGVSIQHTSHHFKRALLEGICFQVISMVKSVEEIHGVSETLFVSGGFTYSPLWVQLLSDMLGRELVQTEQTDTSALGAAIVGFQSLGLSYTLNQQNKKVFKPTISLHSQYDELHNKFEKLYQALKPFFEK